MSKNSIEQQIKSIDDIKMKCSELIKETEQIKITKENDLGNVLKIFSDTITMMSLDVTNLIKQESYLSSASLTASILEGYFYITYICLEKETRQRLAAYCDYNAITMLRRHNYFSTFAKDLVTNQVFQKEEKYLLNTLKHDKFKVFHRKTFQSDIDYLNPSNYVNYWYHAIDKNLKIGGICKFISNELKLRNKEIFYTAYQLLCDYKHLSCYAVSEQLIEDCRENPKDISLSITYACLEEVISLLQKYSNNDITAKELERENTI